MERKANSSYPARKRSFGQGFGVVSKGAGFFVLTVLPLLCRIDPGFRRYQHEVDAYVPQINTSKQALPLLACDLDLLEPETIPWQVRSKEEEAASRACTWLSRALGRVVC